jgi:hypothetical protein
VVTVNWQGEQFQWSNCPVCRISGSKRRVLEMVVGRNIQRSPANDVIGLLRCPVCDACYCDPLCSVDYEASDVEGLKYYLEQGAGIDVMLEPLSLVDGRPIKRYLEIGCGFGFAMDYARRMLGWEVRGFDPGSIATTGKKLLGLPIENAYLGSASIGKGEADLVLCSEVIEHIVDPNGFIEALRRVLGDHGLLLLTTPNSETLSPAMPREMMLPILSPPHHVILYNPACIEMLLRRNGFDHLRVVDHGNQLYVVASAVPLSGMSTCFTRALYRRYLETSMPSHDADSSVGAGYAYRLLKEHVNAGRYSEAGAAFSRLRDGYRQRYGLDIEHVDAVAFPPADNITFKEFGERWPYNLCGVWYYSGLIKLLDQRRPELAASLFSAALKFGAALRRALNTIGTDDLETAQLCREAEIARLAALAQCDPARALASFQELSRNPGALDLERFTAHLLRARRSLFTDLVNLGHCSVARKVIGSEELSIDEPITSDGASTALAWGLFLLNEEGEVAAASAVLARARQTAITVLSSHPNDGETAHLFREAEAAWFAALARYDPTQALVSFRQLSLNPGRLEPAAFATHLQRVRRSLFTDLVNLGHCSVAEGIIESDELPIGEPMTSEDVAAAFAWGLHLLNQKREFAAARHAFALARQGSIYALLSHPDDAEMARLFREAEVAQLAARARYDPWQALSAFQQVTQNQGALDPATFALHLTRVREHLFADLVHLGHYAVAEEVIGSQELPSYEPMTSDDLAVAYAWGLYLLNHKSEFAAASAVFGRVWESAGRTATDSGLLWPARFHQALASRHHGDREAVKLIAEELSAPLPGLPPVPDEYRERLGELLAPSL